MRKKIKCPELGEAVIIEVCSDCQFPLDMDNPEWYYCPHCGEDL